VCAPSYKHIVVQVPLTGTALVAARNGPPQDVTTVVVCGITGPAGEGSEDMFDLRLVLNRGDLSATHRFTAREIAIIERRPAPIIMGSTSREADKPRAEFMEGAPGLVFDDASDAVTAVRAGRSNTGSGGIGAVRAIRAGPARLEPTDSYEADLAAIEGAHHPPAARYAGTATTNNNASSNSINSSNNNRYGNGHAVRMLSGTSNTSTGSGSGEALPHPTRAQRSSSSRAEEETRSRIADERRRRAMAEAVERARAGADPARPRRDNSVIVGAASGAGCVATAFGCLFGLGGLSRCGCERVHGRVCGLPMGTGIDCSVVHCTVLPCSLFAVC
jgi:hypothetical protein